MIKIPLYSKIFFLSVCLLSLTACSLPVGVTIKPETEPQNIEDVYFGRLETIPIPQVMKLHERESVVSTLLDESVMGLEVYGGSLEILSLDKAMRYNMPKNGWKLISSATGKKIIQVYEKEDRLAVITMYNQMFNTAMEIWLTVREGTILTPKSTITEETEELIIEEFESFEESEIVEEIEMSEEGEELENTEVPMNKELIQNTLESTPL